MTTSPGIEKEFDRVSKVLNTIYGRYITHIVYSAIGSGAVVGVFATATKEGGAAFYRIATLFQNPVVVVLIFAVPVLTISWGAGFVYLNTEMWAHRHYLATLERMRSQTEGTPSMGLYSNALWEILYEGGRTRGWLGFSYTTGLTWLTALFPTLVGLASMVLGVFYINHQLYDLYQWPWFPRWFLAVGYGLIVTALYYSVFALKSKINARLRRILESDTTVRTPVSSKSN